MDNRLVKSMQVVDTTLFQLLTAWPQAPGWLVSTASVMASAVVPLVTLGLAVSLWVRISHSTYWAALCSGRFARWSSTRSHCAKGFGP